MMDRSVSFENSKSNVAVMTASCMSLEKGIMYLLFVWRSLLVPIIKTRVVINFNFVPDCWDASTGMCEPIAGKHHTNQVSKLAISGSNLYSISMDDSFRLTSTEKNEYR